MATEKEKKLNPQQKVFVEKYLGEANFNATEAARLASYKGNRNTLGVTAYHLLRIPKIKEEIDEALSAMTMPANAVLSRITQIADGKVTDFYNDKGRFDLWLAKERGVDHLVKKIKEKRTIKQKKTEVRDDMRTFLADDEIEPIESDVEIIYEEVEFELHDAHGALRDLGKYHKLWTDKTEVSGVVGTPQTSDELTDMLNKIYGDDDNGSKTTT
jgi:phage terminase small subunit